MTPDDAEAFFALNSHPDVMLFTGEPPLTSIDQARELITNYPDFDTVGYGRWACIARDTNQMIGFCGLKYLDDLNVTDIGYRFLPEYWGQGLATEAGAASIRFGFDTLQLDTIMAYVLPENAASIRVIEKLGMQPDGQITYDGETALQYKITKPTT